MVVNRSREEWKVYGNVFDKFTINLLRKLSAQGYFEELESALAMGKEANVFTATTKTNKRVIVKIYRLENCNFNKMSTYLMQDPRYISMRKSKREVVFNWVQREYRNLLLARESIRVPTPIAFKKNILIMELIGNPIAPELKNKAPKDPKKFLKQILKNIDLLWKKGLVHADLSAFNILNDSDYPVFIDFSQATVTKSYDSKDFLLRDLKNLSKFFAKLDCEFDINKEFQRITLDE